MNTKNSIPMKGGGVNDFLYYNLNTDGSVWQVRRNVYSWKIDPIGLYTKCTSKIKVEVYYNTIFFLRKISY